MKMENFALLGVRLVALWFAVEGSLMLLRNMAMSAGEFDPSYLGYYFRLVAVEPLILICGAALLFALSPTLGHRIARQKAQTDPAEGPPEG